MIQSIDWFRLFKFTTLEIIEREVFSLLESLISCTKFIKFDFKTWVVLLKPELLEVFGNSDSEKPTKFK